ncbi:unnamed protein product [Chrysoparadoxa australica]
MRGTHGIPISRSYGTLGDQVRSAPSVAMRAPAMKRALNDRFVMKLHRETLVHDLCTTAAYLVTKRLDAWEDDPYGEMYKGALALVKSFVVSLPRVYALSAEPEQVLDHLKLCRECKQTGGVKVQLKNSGDEGEGGSVTVALSVACKYSPDLLAAVTKVLTMKQCVITNASAMCTKDGFALDMFDVEAPSCNSLDSKQLAEEIRAWLEERPGETKQEIVPEKNWVSRAAGFQRVLSSNGSQSMLQVVDHGSGGEVVEGEGDADEQEQGSIPFSKLMFLESLGCGRFSEAYRALLRQGQEEQEVAVKSLLMGQADEQERNRMMKEFQQELLIVASLSHPHILTFYGSSVMEEHYCLVFEYKKGGTLCSYLSNRYGEGLLGTPQLPRLASEIADGLRYLHSQGILHRDLKSSNVLLDEHGHAVICDFGLSCFVEGDGGEHTAETGTYKWMAPEVIQHKPYSEGADVYSYGIVLWELITASSPFLGLTPIQAAFAVARQGLRPRLPPVTPDALAKLVRSCWHGVASRRPSFDQVRENTLSQAYKLTLSSPCSSPLLNAFTDAFTKAFAMYVPFFPQICQMIPDLTSVAQHSDLPQQGLLGGTHLSDSHLNQCSGPPATSFGRLSYSC